MFASGGARRGETPPRSSHVGCALPSFHRSTVNPSTSPQSRDAPRASGGCLRRWRRTRIASMRTLRDRARHRPARQDHRPTPRQTERRGRGKRRAQRPRHHRQSGHQREARAGRAPATVGSLHRMRGRRRCAGSRRSTDRRQTERKRQDWRDGGSTTQVTLPSAQVSPSPRPAASGIRPAIDPHAGSPTSRPRPSGPKTAPMQR